MCAAVTVLGSGVILMSGCSTPPHQMRLMLDVQRVDSGTEEWSVHSMYKTRKKDKDRRIERELVRNYCTVMLKRNARL